MEIPIAVILYVLSSMTAFIAFCGHLLLNLYKTVNEIRTSQMVFQTRAEARIRMLFSGKGPTADEKKDNDFWGGT